jgi:Fur family transcriptional regulator, ferric uptake regulator
MTTMRPTRQRAAIAAALDEHGEFRSAQDIHGTLRQRGASVGLSTVYRTLQQLATNGDVDALIRDDGETVYRRCTTEHHHHLLCRSCGRTVEVTGPTVEDWADDVAAQHGFTQISHTLEIFGVCGDCATST